MKKIAILVALAILAGGCTSAKKQAPAYTTIVATVGTVAHIDVKSSPIPYSAKEVTINFTNNGIVTTFTDVPTGNRISIDGDCVIDNMQRGDVTIHDFRNKDKPNDPPVKSSDPSGNPKR